MREYRAAADEAGLALATVQQWTCGVFNDSATKALADAAWSGSLHTALLDHTVLQKSVGAMHVFSKKVAPEMDVSDQADTGLCWIFAGLSLLRRKLAREFQLPADFELSSAYLLFYDKLEKAHWFLREVWTHRGKHPINDRYLHWLLSDPIQDGGTWGAFASLVAKYGIVPETAFRSSRPARRTDWLNRMLTTLLLQSAARLSGRKEGDPNDEAAAAAVEAAAAAAAEEEITTTCQRVHRLLCVCFGAPPGVDDDVEWSYYSPGDDAETVQHEKITPNTLFAKTGVHFDNCRQLVHIPNLPDGATYEVRGMDTVVGGKHPNRYVNCTDVDLIRAAAKATLDKDTAVWFACEFDEQRHARTAVLHDGLIVHERAIGEERVADKTARIGAHATDVNHAMLLTGYNEVDGSIIDRWQVENSHGEQAAPHKGYLAMTDGWFRNHVFQVVVAGPAKPPARLKRMDPWDVLGFVARVM